MPSLLTERKTNYQLLIAVVLLLLAAGLRFHALAQDSRFHPDEALFAAFARNAAVKGDWLLHGPLDKTPLTIYVQALSMTFFGVHEINGVLDLDIHTGEFAARLPNTFGGILLAAVIYALAKHLYHKPSFKSGLLNSFSGFSFRLAEGSKLSALIAMTLLTLSPYTIAFSATAFTDGLMLLFIVLALWMASAGRWTWSGLYLMLGYASKQQALLYLPLILMVGVFVGTRHVTEGDQRKPCKGNPCRAVSVGKFLRFLTPLAFGFICLFLWDTARAQESGVWALAQLNNDPGRLVRADEILPRFHAWLHYIGLLIGSDWLTTLFIILALLVLAWRLAYQPRQRETMVDILLFTYLIGYFFLHWLVAFNLYDRYLLPVLPIVILLASRGITLIGKTLTPGCKNARTKNKIKKNFAPSLLCAFMLCFLFLSAWNASVGRINVGGDLGKHDGIDVLADYLNSKPVATVIYDRWLGWELDYYLGAWHDKRRTYYPTPNALVQDALLLQETAPRYLPAPAMQPITPWLNALREAGFRVAKVYDTPQFVVYEIIPHSSGVGA